MSFRNGDKSREHRLRKARQQKRETIRKIASGTDAKSSTTTNEKK